MTLCLLASPFAAQLVMKLIPSLSAIATVTAGDSAEKEELHMQEELSRGYGWQEETESSSESVTEATDSQTQSAGPAPYPSSLDQYSGNVIPTSYGAYSGTNYINLDNGGQVRNCTAVSNESLLAESRLLPEFQVELNGTPQVLIMHTHTTESFEPFERPMFDGSFHYRTTDETMNVVAVGNAIAAALEADGIGVIHDTTIHDYPSYNGSYARSAVTVSSILQQYPSICVVLDIHRDAIIAENGDLIQPVVEIAGKKAAQIMIISGCDDGTLGMPNYMKNFRFASALQQQLCTDYEGLMRPILFDYRKYNQDLTTGSLLIEVGSHGNSIDQVVYAGALFGESLSRVLLSMAAK